MKKAIIVFTFLFLIVLVGIANTTDRARADELSDNINEQLENIDLSELEEYINNLENKPDDYSFIDYVNKLLSGEYEYDFTSFIKYTLNSFLGNIYEKLPTFISVFAIAVFCAIVRNLNSSFLSKEIENLIVFFAILSTILILTTEIVSSISNIKITIENIAKLCEIMSPIILTLMIASGGNVSASVYKPAVIFLSSGIVNVFLYVIIPLISLMLAFNIISNISPNVKLTKFSDTCGGIIKFIFGLIITIFTVFLSIQGITSATYDGISFKAAKYAISNSIPIVGGFIKDGFDLVIAGSVLIKNSIGVASIISLFFTILSPVISIFGSSFLLKIVSSLIEPIGESNLCNFCASISKCLNYLIACVLVVGLMLFICILLMIFSANAFI